VVGTILGLPGGDGTASGVRGGLASSRGHGSDPGLNAAMPPASGMHALVFGPDRAGASFVVRRRFRGCFERRRVYLVVRHRQFFSVARTALTGWAVGLPGLTPFAFISRTFGAVDEGFIGFPL